jgi:hypothetical protein
MVKSVERVEGDAKGIKQKRKGNELRVTGVSVVWKVRLVIDKSKLVVVIVMPHRLQGNDRMPRGRRDGFLTSVSKGSSMAWERGINASYRHNVYI